MKTTRSASLRSVLGWNFNYSLVSFFHFTGEHVKEHTPVTIRDAVDKVSISNHALNFQIFNVDSLKSFQIIVGGFMEKLLSLIGDFLMRFSNQYSSLVSLSRALLLSTKASLSTFQELFRHSIELGIINRPIIEISEKGLDFHINANLFIGVRKFQYSHVIARESNNPILCRGASS
jgi:hypothetical protein